MTILQAVFISYLIGSIATFFLFRKHFIMMGSEIAIDILIDQGFLRHKKERGEIVLVKYNEESSSQES